MPKGFVERFARRTVALGNDKVLTDWLRASFRDELYYMLPQNSSSGPRLVFIGCPLLHVVAKGEPAQCIRIRRHELIVQVVFVSIEIRQSYNEIECAKERLGLDGASARALK